MTVQNTISKTWNRIKSGKSPCEFDEENTDSGGELIYAIGDIHGRMDLLLDLLEKIIMDRARTVSSLSCNPKSYIVFLGDYIDRGYSSNQVIEFLSDLDVVGSELIFLKGNHEQVALEFLNPEKPNEKWLSYGGLETLASYGIEVKKVNMGKSQLIALKKSFADTIPEHHLKFLNSLESFWIRGDYMFVHAGVRPGVPVQSQTDKEYLWIRNEFLNNRKKLPYIIVHGHTPENKPVWDGRRIGIDTGAYISNTLTAVKLHKGSVNFLSA